MLWKGRRESDNVEDQRSLGGKSIGAGGLLIGAVIYYLLGGNPLAYVAQNVNRVGPPQASVDSPKELDRKQFVGVVLADTEDVWRAVFKSLGRRYQEPRLVLFRRSVNSGCGDAQSSMGPFYCPLDQKVYLDMSFFDDFSEKLGARGDFARAYVIAHEIGHHVQKLLNLYSNGERGNQASVKIELQADCLAGVWAKQTQAQKNVIESGDLESALNAAAAIGDDRLQRRTQGEVVPDSFTHGSSAQRAQAFRAGFERGQLGACGIRI